MTTTGHRILHFVGQIIGFLILVGFLAIGGVIFMWLLYWVIIGLQHLQIGQILPPNPFQ